MRKYWVLPAHRDRLADQRLLPAYVRQAVDVLGERLHEFTSVTSLAPDVLVNIQIFLAGPGPRVIGAHAASRELAELARTDGPQSEGAAKRRLYSPVVRMVKDVPVALAEPHRAADRPSIPRHPQVVVAGLEAPDIGVAHAGVLRHENLDRVSPELQ